MLSAMKCRFHIKEEEWCGRVIISKRYKMNTHNMKGVRSKTLRGTADKFCQLIHWWRWKCSSVPGFYRIFKPVSETLRKPYATPEKRRKTALKRIFYSNLSCQAVHEDSFLRLQESLKSAVQLAILKDYQNIAVFTDVYNKFWPDIIAHVGERET